MKNKKIIKRLLIHLSPLRGEMAICFICGILGNIMSLSAPVFIGRAVDCAISEGNVDFVGVYYNVVYLIIASLLGSVFYWLINFFSGSLAFKNSCNMRVEFFRKISSVPIKYIDSVPHGDIVSRVVNDLDAAGEGVFAVMGQIFVGIITIVGTLLFMISVDIYLAGIVAVLTPLSLVVAGAIARASFRTFRDQADTQGQLTGYAEEMISGQKVVSAFRYEKRSCENFSKLNKNLYKSGVKAQFYSSVANPITRFITGMIYVTVGAVGAYMIISGGRLTVGGLSAILIYANQYARPFTEITGVITQVQSALAALGRVYEVLDTKSETADIEDPIKIEECKGKVELKNISFSYNESTPFIEDLNLKVEPGQKIAIVGPTGCGKSTIINLLMRFYDPNMGTIKLDDVPIERMTRKDLRSLYGMVLQDTWLYSGSVRDNIAYGKPSATLEEVINAAKLARVHNFISKLDRGYDTVLSEDGDNISQGQKQLISIARVIITDPKILILDEATSSIDTRTEIKVQEAFNELMKGRTSFIVAHRLSTIKNADMILVMKNGEIIERGNHSELLKKGEFYSTLYYSQFAEEY